MRKKKQATEYNKKFNLQSADNENKINSVESTSIFNQDVSRVLLKCL